MGEPSLSCYRPFLNVRVGDGLSELTDNIQSKTATNYPGYVPVLHIRSGQQIMTVVYTLQRLLPTAGAAPWQERRQ